jgi:hypothetical protein
MVATAITPKIQDVMPIAPNPIILGVLGIVVCCSRWFVFPMGPRSLDEESVLFRPAAERRYRAAA